jgi:hypothetical protein
VAIRTYEGCFRKATENFSRIWSIVTIIMCEVVPPPPQHFSFRHYHFRPQWSPDLVGVLVKRSTTKLHIRGNDWHVRNVDSVNVILTPVLYIRSLEHATCQVTLRTGACHWSYSICNGTWLVVGGYYYLNCFRRRPEG